MAVKPGEWIRPGQVVIKIADLSQWTVETDEIKETDITQVKPGAQVQVSLAAYPDLKLAGLVETVDQLYTEDEGDIFYKAKIKLEDSDPRLRWGMSAHVDFGSP